MASLPSQHPHLALHLTDRALTPIISSSSSSSTKTKTSAASSQRSSPFSSSKPTKTHRPTTFSTSPPSSDDDSDDSSEDDDSDSSTPHEPEDEKSQALAHLTSTALASYDAAKRLEKGAPLRTMVEYPGLEGPVVLHSYMCPMSLALGVPGRKASNESLQTAGGGGGAVGRGTPAADENGGAEVAAAAGGGTNTNHNNHSQRDPPTNRLSKLAIRRGGPRDTDDTDDDDGVGDGDDVGGEGQDSPNGPPMLIGTVVAPKADDLRDARRAAGRLERVARVFQTEWLAAEGTGDGAGT